MRRPDVLKSLTAFSLAGLVLAAAACATSAPVEDDALAGVAGEDGDGDGKGQATSKLPPASNPPSTDTKDAGAPKDSGVPKDSGSTPADSGPPPNTGICDPSDPMNFLKIMLVGENATPCPCSATECCLQGADICLPN